MSGKTLDQNEAIKKGDTVYLKDQDRYAILAKLNKNGVHELEILGADFY